MTPDQKAICRELLKQSYSSGFDSSYPLAPIAEKLGIKGVLYDEDTETGILWELGPYGNGMLEFGHQCPVTHAWVCMDTRDMLELWSRE